MRSGDEIKKIILDKANGDIRIRAVLLNGSRANYKVQPDRFQDFDVVFIVEQLEAFISDHAWISLFGEKLIWQLPNEMTTGNDGTNKSCSFPYLMLFTDGNRIDLTLFPQNKLETDFKTDSLTIVWLDKDNLFHHIKESSDKDYWIRRPMEKEFQDACNEFWFICTNVSKGLVREEVTYAKTMLEIHVRPEFMKMIEWHIGTRTDFSVSAGKGGKFMNKYLTAEEYTKILTTYGDYNINNIWNSLFVMTDLFSGYAEWVANKLNFAYNRKEQINVISYLREQYQTPVNERLTSK